MNYVQQAQRAMEAQLPSPISGHLSRLYALLVLTHGTSTTRQHVHDAWSFWRDTSDPTHPSLVPFDELSEQVQALDQPYVDAIHAAARQLQGESEAP